MKTTLNRALAPIVAMLALATHPVGAAEGDDIISAEILPGWQTEAGTYMAALQLTLAPGWKTYWRAPGDAGIPPRFDWAGSQNLAGVQMHWPRPTVFTSNGMRSIGYDRAVVLPIELTPARPGAPIALAVHLDLGVCQDICVPVELRVSGTLPGAGASAQAAPIRAALDSRPEPAGAAQVRDVRCTVDPIRDGLRLTADIAMPALGPGDGPGEIAVFELPDPTIWVSEAQTTRRGDRLVAEADLVPETGQPFALDRSSVRITVLGAERAVDIQGCAGR